MGFKTPGTGRLFRTEAARDAGFENRRSRAGYGAPSEAAAAAGVLRENEESLKAMIHIYIMRLKNMFETKRRDF
jgi:hypothetical protein